MGLWESVAGLPAGIANSFFSSFSNLLAAFIQPLLDVAKLLLTANIDPFHFQNFWQIIVAIISSFYLLVFLVVGFKFLFGCYDAVQRKDAKEWFKKAVLLVICVNASLLLYSLLLSVSSAVALTIWNNQFEAVFSVSNLTALDFVWLSVFALFLFSAVVTLVARQIMLIVGVMLFPIGLFLYFLPPVKEYGSAILNLIGAVSFMNVLDVVILAAVSLFWNEFAYIQVMGLLAPSIGFLFISLANGALAFFAIQKALNAVGIKVDLASTAASLIGPALAAGV